MINILCIGILMLYSIQDAESWLVIIIYYFIIIRDININESLLFFFHFRLFAKPIISRIVIIR